MTERNAIKDHLAAVKSLMAGIAANDCVRLAFIQLRDMAIRNGQDTFTFTGLIFNLDLADEILEALPPIEILDGRLMVYIDRPNKVLLHPPNGSLACQL